MDSAIDVLHLLQLTWPFKDSTLTVPIEPSSGAHNYNHRVASTKETPPNPIHDRPKQCSNFSVCQKTSYSPPPGLSCSFLSSSLVQKNQLAVKKSESLYQLTANELFLERVLEHLSLSFHRNSNNSEMLFQESEISLGN